MVDRVFVDANVLFSAVYSEGSRVGLLFDLARATGVRVFASSFVIEEARRNVKLKRPEALGTLEHLLLEIVVVANAQGLPEVPDHGLPEKDVPVLAGAIAAEATYLVTGDRTHFGHLFGRTFAGVRVASVAETIEALLAM